MISTLRKLAKLICATTVLIFGGHPAHGIADTSGKQDRPASNTDFNVRGYGAVGDGQAIDSPAINQAIDACAAAGGGRVLFPPGRYLSGTVLLKSRITLVFEAGATLIGSTNLSHYEAFRPPAGTPEARFKSTWHRALILGDNLENIAILGPGIIDGNKVFDPQGEERMRGPHTILLGNSRNVVFRDIVIKDSANYAVMLEFSHDVEVRNIKITGGWDGVHFRGWPGRPCRNVTIVGCQFYTGDDAIAGRYWENVLISDCILNSSCNGFRLIGPATHLIIHNCLFYGPGVEPHRTGSRYNMLAGINLQPGAWDATEGLLDDVLISDVTMHNVATPFMFTLKPGNTAGRISVNRVAASGVYRAASSVESWAAAPFTNVVFRDVSIEYDGGGTLATARLPVRSPGVDARPLPAWGFYARNVQNLSFENVRLSCSKDDLRPVFIGESVDQISLDGFKFARPDSVREPLLLTNVAQVRLRDTHLSKIEPRYLSLNSVSDDPTGLIAANRPFSVSVKVENGNREGIAQVELMAAGKTMTQWVWLAPAQQKEVVFRGLAVPKAGTTELKAGPFTEALVVQP